MLRESVCVFVCVMKPSFILWDVSGLEASQAPRPGLRGSQGHSPLGLTFNQILLLGSPFSLTWSREAGQGRQLLLGRDPPQHSLPEAPSPP